MDEPLAPERYKVQFTASEEYVRLVQEAKALLSHATPHATLEDIQLRAMRALVAELKKKKYGASAEGSGMRRQASDKKQPRQRGAEPRQRGRHVPASVRRAVFERDGNRCAYVDAAGRRCSETRQLEFHHVEPFARGGEHTESNVTLRCRAHNGLAAEEDFGREGMQEKQRSGEHEPFRDQLGSEH